MQNKLSQKNKDIEMEMQKLREGFLALKEKRKTLQEKIDSFKRRDY